MPFDAIKSIFSGGGSSTGPETISGPTAVQFHNDPDVVFIDVRGLGEIQSSGTVKGAIRAPLPELSKHAQPQGGGSIPPISANKRIICVCASGARSGVAAQQLLKLGYQDVANLRGGIGTWIGAGGPVER